MALGDNGATIEASEPDLEQARRTATVAHEVVIKLKAMGAAERPGRRACRR